MTILLLLILAALPLAAQTGDLNGTTAKLVNDGTAAHTAMPVSMCVRAKPANISGFKMLVTITNQATTHQLSMMMENANLRCEYQGSISSANISVAGAFSAATWGGGCCVFDGPTLTAVTASTSNSGGLNIGSLTGLDYTALGVRRVSSSDGFFYNGLISEAATWGRALSVAQAQSYLNGARAQDVAGGGADHIWGGFWGVDYGSGPALALTNTDVTCTSEVGPGTSSVPENCSGPITAPTPAVWFQTSEAMPQELVIDSCSTETVRYWDTFSNGEQQFNEPPEGTTIGDGCLPYRPLFRERP